MFDMKKMIRLLSAICSALGQAGLGVANIAEDALNGSKESEYEQAVR